MFVCLPCRSRRVWLSSLPSRLHQTATYLSSRFAQIIFPFLLFVLPQSGTSALMKLVCWHLESAIEPDEAFCHQADYVAAHVTGARVRRGQLRAAIHTAENIKKFVEKFQRFRSDRFRSDRLAIVHVYKWQGHFHSFCRYLRGRDDLYVSRLDRCFAAKTTITAIIF